MKKSDLVSVSVLVKDALAFFNDFSASDLTLDERSVLTHLSVADFLLFSLTSVSDEC